MIKVWVRIWDSGEAWADRYTVEINGFLYGMGETAISPGGYNQCIGNSSLYTPWIVSMKGKEVRLVDLPKETLIAIIRRMEDVV